MLERFFAYLNTIAFVSGTFCILTLDMFKIKQRRFCLFLVFLFITIQLFNIYQVTFGTRDLGDIFVNTTYVKLAKSSQRVVYKFISINA